MRYRDLETLEFNKFLKYLSEYTPNKLTKDRILNIRPSSDEKEVIRKVEETKAILDILYKEGYFPLTEYPDITKALELLAIEESVLSPFELLDIASVLRIARDLKNFLYKHIKNYESLSKYYKNLYPSKDTEKIIYDSIDNSGMIKDTASRDLANIRKSIRDIENKIKSILENIINSYKYQDIIQEKIITIRKDRFVIPVRQNFSSKLQGIIHDRSSSGQTIYLEPVNIVELNNKLSDLKIREHIEIRKILKFLTDLIRNRYVNLKDTFNSIIHFDYLQTLAKFGKEVNGVFPQISKEINLIEAIHPIFAINKKEFKPLNIKINSIKRGLVLTGSNTGGKTITLKTLGLSAFLFQSGIPIPALEGSKLPVFDWVYSDIGDMQSIEQNLSTYSAHIKNINEILKLVTDKSLVLLDELIPGTDPDEASAIGIGIMEKLKEKRAYVLITTHFKPIKIYALSSDYYEVASVGFDKKTLSPTYTIHYKTIGQSMAFYIAEKLDFDKEILKTAKKYIDTASLELNKAIDKLENYKDELEKELKEISNLKKELKENKDKYEALKNELEEYKKQKWKEAIKEVEDYIKNIREEGHKLIEEIKQKGAGKKLEKFLKEKRGDLTQLAENLDEKENIYQFNIGDKVKVKGGNSIGEIISIREGKANVKFKKFKMWVNLKDLEKVEEKVGIKKPEKQIKFNIRREKSKIKNEINLIGKTKDEAINELSTFLDKAILEGFSTVRIIHGYGSGILRKAVREYLNRLPYDIEYQDAPYSEGGMGVTIVHIK
jgi:DNA mismatch repair protein MutS2